MTVIALVVAAVLLVLAVGAAVVVRLAAVRRRRLRRSRGSGRTQPLSIHPGWLPMMADPRTARAPRHQAH